MTVRDKPTNPYPPVVRRLLRRILPERVFRRYIGRHETQSLAWWERLAAHVTPAEAVLDVGAFHGEYALAARKANAAVEVYAFEPDPNSAERLQRVGAHHQIRVVAAAVAECDGHSSFVLRDARSGLLNPGVAVDDEVAVVPTVSLDSWSRTQGVKPALIKIDAECAEPGILRGAREILTCYRPIILCEVLTDAAGAEVESALPGDYCFYAVDENRGLVRQPRITRRRWRDKNWLFVPQGHTDVIASIRRNANAVSVD